MTNVIDFVAVDHAFSDEALVLDNISMEVEQGEIFGIVGPSGSGKTTVVRIIVGLLEPSSGTVMVDGMPPYRFGAREKRRLGYMPQSFSL